MSAIVVRASEGADNRAYLDVAVSAASSPARALEVLGPARASWIGEDSTSDQPAPAGMERYLIDLRMRVGEHARIVTFRKAAYLDLGPAREGDGGVAVEISWRAAGLAPLFPVFSGHLTWAAETLRVTGVYEPPGGGVGVIADRLLFNMAARGTARWLLERIARVLAGEAPDQAG
jgi:hypothetical protein